MKMRLLKLCVFFWLVLSASLPLRSETFLDLVEPAPNDASSPYTTLTQLVFTFSDPISNAVHNMFRLNGIGSENDVLVSNNVVFVSFPQPSYGMVRVVVQSGAVQTITGDTNVDYGYTYDYYLQDVVKPTLTNRFPAAGATVRELSQADVFFSEPVQRIYATNLLINGKAATNLIIRPGGWCTFQFPPQSNGVVQYQFGAGQRIADFGTPPNTFTSPAAWTNYVNTNLLWPDLAITEFCAANRTGLRDESGLAADWIEIQNRGATNVNLAGWSLSNDPLVPGKWIFPSKVLAPNAYLVVFASSKDIRTPAGTNKFHANFCLSSGGEFLGLFAPDSPRRFVSGYNPAFPEQHNDYSYGINPNGQWCYFANPTPGAANQDSVITNICQPVHFSVQRGYFTQPFDLVLSSPTPGAAIYYTLNGFDPNPNNSILYTGPVRIAATSFLRAIAYRTNLAPSKISTHSFFFGLTPANLSLPILSIVTDTNSLIGPQGITSISGGKYLANGGAPWVAVTTNDYNNNASHGREWERPVSAEYIRFDGTNGFQIDCGIRVQGSSYTRLRYKNNSKFGYRLYFRGDYGEGKLRYPLFPTSNAEEFDVLVLRAGHNDTNPFIRDEMGRRIFQEMGYRTTQGNLVNLFINGVYKGYYNPTEHLGEDSYDVWEGTADYDRMTAQSVLQSGDRGAWNELCSLFATNIDLMTTANYQAVAARLDLTNMVDYILLEVYAGNNDWPHNNWTAARERATASPFRYHLWDIEMAFQNPGGGGATNADYFSPSASLQGLSEFAMFYRNLYNSGNLEFRQLFADRIQKHFFNGGALMDANFTNHFLKLRSEIIQVLPAFNMAFLTNNYVPNRRPNLFSQFALYGLYSSNAPVFSQFGGLVPAGFALGMTNSMGDSIYYTTNGVDPRVAFTGAIAGSARLYAVATKPVISKTMVIKARAYNGSEWSPLVEATFEVASLTSPLRVTEINYNPPGGNAYEFIELYNSGPVPLDISGWSIEDGITFIVPSETILAAGARAIIANNFDTNAFKGRYPSVTVLGYFAGNLANGGERFIIRDEKKNIVLKVTYDDEGGWPTAPDGSGPTLEIIDPLGDPGDPANWRASSTDYGSPGVLTSVPVPQVRLNELMAYNRSAVNQSGNFPDWVELYNAGTNSVDLAGWRMSDNGNASKFVFPSNTLIQATNFLVVWCDTNYASPGLHAGFELDRSGSRFYLYDTNGVCVDAVGFGQQLADYSLGIISNQWTLTLPTLLATNVIAPVGSATNLVINEWLANPAPGGSDWFELYNRGALPVALKGLYVANSNEVQQITWNSFVPAFGYALLYADEGPAPDHLDFNLPASGGAVMLYNSLAQLVDKVTYTNQVETVSRGRMPDGSTSFTDFVNTASPGTTNYLDTYAGPMLNEVLARNLSALTNAGHTPDFVELFYAGSTNFNLGGMSLSVDTPRAGQFVFPPGTIMYPFSHLVVWCDTDRPASTNLASLNTGQGIAAESGGVFLFNPAGQLVDAVEFGPQVADKSIGLSGGDWKLQSSPTPGSGNAGPQTLADAAQLRLNEWMADPATGPDWFELYNLDSLPVELSGLFLTDDLSVPMLTKHRIPPLSFIGGKGWVRFLADGDLAQGRQHVNFSLDGLGECLAVVATNGSAITVLDQVAFGRQTPGVSQGHLPDGDASSTCYNFPGSASPGEANFLLLTNVVISEILPRPAGTGESAIEIQNTGLTGVDLSGWYLSDNQSNFRKWRIPGGTWLSAWGFAVFSERQFTNAAPVGFNLDPLLGGEVWLSAADASSNLTGYRVLAKYHTAATGISQGRFTTQAGLLDYVAQSAVTMSNANASPLIGPVVINEIMYHAPALTNNATDDEYVELFNGSGATVPCYDVALPTNVWRLRGGISFDFPAGTTMAPYTYLLVVNFDPTNSPVQAAFRARFNVPTNVTCLGPFSGKLANSGDRVELKRPDAPLKGAVPYVNMDVVEYSDSTPWPSAADGTGAALQRRAAAAFGNDPENWAAAMPTAGAANNFSSAELPVILAGPQSVGAPEYGATTLTVTATGGAPLGYQWRWNGVPLSGETNGALYFDYVVRELAGYYDVLVNNSNGTVLSASALLRVVNPPVINSAPSNQFVRVGTNLSLAVSATGNNLTYQWRKNGTNLSGATTPSLLLNNFQVADQGLYEIWVSNLEATEIRAATLIALQDPAFLHAPLAQNVATSERFTLSVCITGAPAPFTYEWRAGATPLATNTNSLAIDFLSLVAPAYATQINYTVVVRNLANTNGVASGAATVNVLLDSDGDGMPDAWELQFGLNPNSNTDRNLDQDGDGMSNYQEYRAGTNPTNALQVLRVNPQVESNGITLQFVALTNRTYSIQAQNGLSAGTWLTLTNLVATATNRTQLLFAPPQGSNRFYRIVTPVQ